MKYKRVIYLGVLPNNEGTLVGGYATANKRNVNEYKKRNIKIIAIAYPILKDKSISEVMIYLLQWNLYFFKCVYYSLFTPSKHTLVHITPLYKYFIYVEYFCVLILKLSNKTILTDIRAGSFIDYYKKNTFIYRFFIKNLLRISEHVTVEGLIYKEFIIKTLKHKRELLYYPNYVETQQICKRERGELDKNSIQMIYFGRINKEKGIYTILKTHRLLKKHFKLKTIVIGSFDKPDLKIELSKHNQEGFTLLPQQNREAINEALEKSHFFIFPSTHAGEGQSNSLTESMACGLVPIVSDNGFNKSIIANCGIVISKKASEFQYAKAIEHIINENLWSAFSKKARERIIKEYSNHTVCRNFFNYINRKK